MAKKEKLARFCKEKMVDEVTARIDKQPNFIATNYMGSTVADLELLRRNLRKSSSNYIIVKNSILKIVFDRLKLQDLASSIDSGMGISLGGEDIVSTCKVLVTFTKDHGKFKIKYGFIDGKVVTAERLRVMASLPSRDVLMRYVVGGIKSPITGFVNTLSGILRKFVYVVDAIKTSREKETKIPEITK